MYSPADDQFTVYYTSTSSETAHVLSLYHTIHVSLPIRIGIRVNMMRQSEFTSTSPCDLIPQGRGSFSIDEQPGGFLPIDIQVHA